MDALSAFLARHALARFRHRERLLDGLRDRSVELVHVPGPHECVACTGLLDSYARLGSSLTDARGGYRASLREDLRVLCEALWNHQGHDAALWAFHLPPGFTFSVWECGDDGALLGCVLGIERALTDEDTFTRFFG